MGGNRDGNRVGGGNKDVNGDGDGNRNGNGNGGGGERRSKMGAGREARAGRERGRGRRWRFVDVYRMGTGRGAGTETRAVVNMGRGTRMVTETGTRTESGSAEEWPRSAKQRRIVVDTIRHFHSARVIISADRGTGACGHPTASFASPGGCTRASHRGGNRVRATGRSGRG